jgi:hypothetical protein
MGDLQGSKQHNERELMKTLKITQAELEQLQIAIDHRLDDWRNLPYELDELDEQQQADYQTCSETFAKISGLLRKAN